MTDDRPLGAVPGPGPVLGPGRASGPAPAPGSGPGEEARNPLTLSVARTRELERKVHELQAYLRSNERKNESLVRTLKDARDRIAELKAEIGRLTAAPNAYGVILARHDDGTVDVLTSGRRMRVAASADLSPAELTEGRLAVLNEALNVAALAGFDRVGDVVTVKERLDEARVLVISRADDEKVAVLIETLREGKQIRAGDAVLVDTRTGFVLEKIPRAEVTELVLEEVPDIAYSDIGGLAPQIEQIRDAVELPYLHPELYREHHLKPPKGVLLYGPPGCGKTLIAKAVAASLAQQVAARGGEVPEKSYFLNIKGPELLNKYVGETERHIRLIFQRAREKASDGSPVVVFFDEMDSLFRTRGSGVSSDVETTIVPQLLSEIDGVERLDNVVVIGASNREDMIDPAILRPGRLDVKIKIERPDAAGATDIFGKYLTVDVPLHPDDVAEFGGTPARAVAGLIAKTVERMYADTDENKFLEVTYASGDREVLYFKDFNSGAMIQNIVDRAKKMAIKDFLTDGERGLRLDHLLQACDDEFHENEDLPNTTNPDDWARISGKKGERIVYIRTLISGKDGVTPGRSITAVAPNSQYL